MTEHEKLVERVAQLIAVTPGLNSDVARAAVAECYRTLMEPDAAMIEAGEASFFGRRPGDKEPPVRRCIRAMLVASPLNANTEDKP